MANDNKIFYIADPHFGDKKTWRWDAKNGGKRFNSVSVRDEAIIEGWNSRVTNRDQVYIIGDAFGSTEEHARRILKRLNGSKHFIRGNHDKKWLADICATKKYSILEYVDYKKISDNGRKVVMSHYPIMFWDGQHDGDYHVYGHVHASDEERLFQKFGQEFASATDGIPEFRAMNAGCMLYGYEPQTLDELTTRYGIGKATKSDFRRKE